MYPYRVSVLYILTTLLLAACHPELPVTSTIRIDMESSTVPLNDDFYGLSIDEGEIEAIKAELVRNGSFSDDDSLPGWQTLAPYTYIARSSSRPVQPEDLYSLMVSANPSGPDRRGGVAAFGYDGIKLRRTERYNLSFYLRTSFTTTPVQLEVALEDSAGAKLSLPWTVMPTYAWTRHRHSFIATSDASNARLAFYMRESSLFFIDQISLIPQTTWNNRGLRQDVMELVDSIGTTFISGRGGAADNAATGIPPQDLSTWHSIDSARTMQKAYYADEAWLISNHDFASMFPAGVRIYELGCIEPEPASLRAVIAQACFLLRAESQPQVFRQISFAPIAGRYDSNSARVPLILTESGQPYTSPTYHLVRMLAHNTGDVIVPAEVSTYARPQVERAAPAIDVVDNSLEALDWSSRKSNAQDSTYNYEILASLRPLTDAPTATLHISRTLSLRLEGNRSILYRHTGTIMDTLGIAAINLADGRPHDLRIACHYDTVQCYFDNASIHRAVNPTLPSIVAVAMLENSSRTILLKVVNTTFHAEKTAIRIHGGSPRRTVDVIQMKGAPDLQNTASAPRRIVPETTSHTFAQGQTFTYHFPPNSVTIMKLRVD